MTCVSCYVLGELTLSTAPARHIAIELGDGLVVDAFELGVSEVTRHLPGCGTLHRHIKMRNPTRTRRRDVRPSVTERQEQHGDRQGVGGGDAHLERVRAKP